MLKKDLYTLKTFVAESLASDPPTRLYIYWEPWWEMVKKSMASEPSWNPNSEENQKRARMCYNQGYTPDEFEEEWLSLEGLL